MFERRLKLFLVILLCVMGVLLLRAFHLQVLTKNAWRQEAEDFNKREIYTETTRGRILDHNGVELAVDEGCMDACVDYRAISRNKKWIETVATARLIDRLGQQYKSAAKADRVKMVADESGKVNEDIDRMFALLADVSGQKHAEIDELVSSINLKVAMRTRYVQWKRYQTADEEHDKKEPPPWYRQWLIEGGNGGPSVDDFEQESGEETDAHPIVKNISNETYLRLARESSRCPGLVLRAGTVRRYPQGTAGAHVLGLLSAVGQADLKADANYLDPLRKYEFTDVIGRSGLERMCEPALRGVRGKLLRQSGRRDEIVESPVPGRDVRATIDIGLQAELQRMFEHMKVPLDPTNSMKSEKIEVAMHGAAVVIDVRTGYVRALASYPDYDPNALLESYESVLKRTDDAPLMNRATQWAIEPGSTIKPVVGLSGITAGLNIPDVGVLTPHTGIECTGYLVINKRKMPNGRCWVATKFADVLHGQVAHHPIPSAAPHKGAFGNPDGFLCYADALERSCNVYFETIANSFGVDGLSFWFDRFGLGRETGIGIAEARGYLPNRIKSPWPAHAWFSGIGQTGVLATPIQMANVAATIARDGTWMRPKLVEDAGGVTIPGPTTRGGVMPDVVDLQLNKEALAACREGMTRVVNSVAGTGDFAQMDSVLVAGKTGTAEAKERYDIPLGDDDKPITNENGDVLRIPWPKAFGATKTSRPWYRGAGKDGSQLNHAWFIGFAPANDPQVAFAIMIEYGGSGNFAAMHAPKVVEECVKRGYIKN
jgi:penicillin-binding protein 2